MNEFVEVQAVMASHQYHPCDTFANPDLSDATDATRQGCEGLQHSNVHPLLLPDGVKCELIMPGNHNEPFDGEAGLSQDSFVVSATSFHLSDYELSTPWKPEHLYPQLFNNCAGATAEPDGYSYFPYSSDPLSLPESSYQSFEEGDGRSPWSSSPEFGHSRTLVSGEDDDGGLDDKPYARLIYEALMQAPDHRMMLREIYEWFRNNTTKPQESGSNGWQNSIRHNLSMNRAFENDRDNTRGNSRKPTSVWVLTEEAIKNGVQSTTRYRKTGSKRTLGNRAPAIQRQRSGARGGRAARRTARQRRQEQSFFTDPTPSDSPATTAYSDYSEYPSFDTHDLPPAVCSWPMTPMKEDATGDIFRHDPVSPPSTLNVMAQRLSYGEESLRLQDALQASREQHFNELVRFISE